jgi:hypothetical protein
LAYTSKIDGSLRELLPCDKRSVYPVAMVKTHSDVALDALLDRIEAIARSLPGTREHDELLARVEVLYQFLSSWQRVVYGDVRATKT